jgi:RimJ/RimL family protein N-acetyltransferase/predicted enzyme related to lactoylglutathione lyase
MPSHLGLVALLVRDYDEAIAFYVGKLGFVLIEDRLLDTAGKRWVVVAPHSTAQTKVLLACASDDRQAGRIGDQTGGRVFLFMHTDDLDRDLAAYRTRGVVIVREPKTQAYGTVAVIADLHGNLWDLIQPRADRGSPARTEPSTGHLAVPSAVCIRALLAADAPAYRELMLEAYTRDADAFTSTAQERDQEPESWWVHRIADPMGLGLAFGATIDGRLVGSVAIEYSSKPKTRHSALIIGMIVQPHARGRGVGRRLLEAALHHASLRPGLRVLNLTVTEDNQSAVRLYASSGFRVWGTEPLAILTPSGLKNKLYMGRDLASDDSA